MFILIMREQNELEEDVVVNLKPLNQNERINEMRGQLRDLGIKKKLIDTYKKEAREEENSKSRQRIIGTVIAGMGVVALSAGIAQVVKGVNNKDSNNLTKSNKLTGLEDQSKTCSTDNSTCIEAVPTKFTNICNVVTGRSKTDESTLICYNNNTNNKSLTDVIAYTVEVGDTPGFDFTQNLLVPIQNYYIALNDTYTQLINYTYLSSTAKNTSTEVCKNTSFIKKECFDQSDIKYLKDNITVIKRKVDDLIQNVKNNVTNNPDTNILPSNGFDMCKNILNETAKNIEENATTLVAFLANYNVPSTTTVHLSINSNNTIPNGTNSNSQSLNNETISGIGLIGSSAIALAVGSILIGKNRDKEIEATFNIYNEIYNKTQENMGNPEEGSSKFKFASNVSNLVASYYIKYVNDINYNEEKYNNIFNLMNKRLNYFEEIDGVYIESLSMCLLNIPLENKTNREEIEGKLDTAKKDLEKLIEFNKVNAFNLNLEEYLILNNANSIDFTNINNYNNLPEGTIMKAVLAKFEEEDRDDVLKAIKALKEDLNSLSEEDKNSIHNFIKKAQEIRNEEDVLEYMNYIKEGNIVKMDSFKSEGVFESTSLKPKLAYERISMIEEIAKELQKTAETEMKREDLEAQSERYSLANNKFVSWFKGKKHRERSNASSYLVPEFRVMTKDNLENTNENLNTKTRRESFKAEDVESKIEPEGKIESPRNAVNNLTTISKGQNILENSGH